MFCRYEYRYGEVAPDLDWDVFLDRVAAMYAEDDRQLDLMTTAFCKAIGIMFGENK